MIYRIGLRIVRNKARDELSRILKILSSNHPFNPRGLNDLPTPPRPRPQLMHAVREGYTRTLQQNVYSLGGFPHMRAQSTCISP